MRSLYHTLFPPYNQDLCAFTGLAVGLQPGPNVLGALLDDTLAQALGRDVSGVKATPVVAHLQFYPSW